ncbi:PHP domain-containing protein [Halorhodospira halophila]|uniref:PHP C-terminal domain protein n=1 Tax=Halorhodospira halophila (strain DSM 244 / SL1) TaxID=349124 RepID=A1WTD2_HALHL|nr:PHP domain-containing protein [Halorhodospira halophila]ABM60944.1 PHP C-terminal domain protein [Halorhodospira halophila SL1]MBK1728602.1 PHP domain-containing protein [Halorhodospira halophila]
MSACQDLHCHSSASDGHLAPAAVVHRAAERGVETLALTDHDTVAGIEEARAAAAPLGLRLVAGLELSVLWQGRTFHVVGLGVDPDEPGLKAGLAQMQRARQLRGEAIGERLERAGLSGAREGARAAAGAADITRAHYARWMVDNGKVRGYEEAFRRYLRRGRVGYVHGDWVAMEEGIEWIRGAGGIAVLAHPLGYDLTGAWIRRVLDAFAAAGGEGMEVSCGTSPEPRQVQQLGGWCRRYRLLASIGSDFHGPGHPSRELGAAPPLPGDLPTVLEALTERGC